MAHFFARAVPCVAAVVALSVPPSRSAAAQVVASRGAVPRADTLSRRGALDSLVAVATFDSAWRIVGLSLENRGIERPDWDSVRHELRPLAARAVTDSALRAVIDDMLRRLGESHFAILAGARAPGGNDVATAGRRGGTLGTAGVEPRIVDGRLIAWRVEPDGPARRAGLAPGWTLLRIDDVSVPRVPARSDDHRTATRRLSAMTDALRALHGAPGSTVRIVARDDRGVRRTLRFRRDSVRGPTSQFGNLPVLPAGLAFTRRTISDGRCIAVIAFEYWLPPVMPALDRAIDSARTCAGVVLDLRGNLGGVAGMTMGVAGHFLTEPRVLGTMRARGEELRFVANPRRVTDDGSVVEPFGGPVAILVDELSASTSEMFAVGLQALGRARVFGERSAGQALPAMATRLPNGDVLMHVIADFVAPDGSRIEGRGVMPDELVPTDLAAIRAGRDPTLQAAVRWIARTPVLTARSP